MEFTQEAFTEIKLNFDKPKTVWVVTMIIRDITARWKAYDCYHYQYCDFLPV